MDRLFDEMPKGAISDIIIARIRDAIIDGTLKPGDKIPTETEFSENLGVSRNSVREAIKTLVGYGVLEIRRAEGTFVVDQYNPKMLDPLLYGVLFVEHSMKELLDVKIALANAMLYTAILNATDEEIDTLQMHALSYKNSMHTTMPDIDEIYNASKDYHNCMGELCHNPILLQLDTIVHQIAKFSRRMAIEASIEQNRLDDLPENYLKEVEILKRRDIHAITDFMTERYELWKELLLQETN